MLSYLANFEQQFGPLRLLRFISLRMVLAAFTAAMIGFVAGPWLIRRLRALKWSHQYDDDRTGGLGSKFDKKNTPSMGGMLIFGAVFASTLLWAEPNVWVLVSMSAYAALTGVGVRDDYLKIVRNNRRGMSSRDKLLWQAAITVCVLTALLLHPQSAHKIRELWVPFVKHPLVTAMPVALLFVMVFVWLAGFSNAINLTDGLDGLAVGCTITVALVYGVLSYASGNTRIANYLLIGHVAGTGELAVICGAVVGAAVAFLWYNSPPAEVIMGDTGSLALGGLLGLIAFMVQQPPTLLIVGGVFVLEALSVIIQVGYFKATRRIYGDGRRVFLLAPIHHHFQKLGWPEEKIVVRFWIVSFICALVGLATLKLR